MRSHLLCITLAASLFTSTGFVLGKETKQDLKECICTAKQLSKAFTTVAKTASPAVVFIKVESTPCEQDMMIEGGRSPFDSFNDDFFERFFGVPRGKRGAPKAEVSQGSGFITSEDGIILTNAHVVAGAEKISVVLHDGRELPATLIGLDPSTDIAVIKVDGKKLPTIKLGDSDEVEVGEWVVAIGSPFQLESSVTVGVISAKGRQNLRITDLEDFIQTDAAINPGNSGGPLINLEGDVIGINTAIVSRSGGYMGIGFAIPSNLVKHIMDQLIQKGVVTRGFIGIIMQPIDKDIAEAYGLTKPDGALVSQVEAGSPADKAGLKQGDIILEYNGTPVRSIGAIRKDISFMNPGSNLSLKVSRKGQILTIDITLGSVSDKTLAVETVTQKLGIEVQVLSPELSKQLGYTHAEEGLVITKIRPGSPAAQAGLRPGFLIMGVNHKKVASLDEFNQALQDQENKKLVLLLIKINSAQQHSQFFWFKIE